MLGILVMPEAMQSEGVAPVLDRLAAVGVTDIGLAPYAMRASDAGSREPPQDGPAGGVRQLDRPLWGCRELNVVTAPCYRPDLARYAATPYAPGEPTDWSLAEGAIVTDAIEAAAARGIRTWMLVQSAIPPGYRFQFGGPRPDDTPVLPDGSVPAIRVDRVGTLASPAIRSYGAALVADVAAAFPGIAGLRLDWPEYPPYTLDAVFLDFSPAAQREAGQAGYDVTRMRRDAQAVRALLHGGLTRLDVSPAGVVAAMRRLTEAHPGLADLFAFKRQSASGLATALRAALPSGLGLVAQAFPPPSQEVSGFDFAQPSWSGIGVKLYTMHWSMTVRYITDQLAAANPDVDPAIIARAVVALADLDDVPHRVDPAVWHYPESDEPHPSSAAAQQRKVHEARRLASGTPVHPIMHGYGPVDDVRARFAAARDASDGTIWINRYGYLSDAKLHAICAAMR